MTLAVAHWLCLYIEEDHPEEKLIETMQKYGREYPLPDMEVRSTPGYGVRIQNLTTAG